MRIFPARTHLILVQKVGENLELSMVLVMLGDG